MEGFHLGQERGPTERSFLGNVPWKQLTQQTAGENVSVYLCAVSGVSVCVCVHEGTC